MFTGFRKDMLSSERNETCDLVKRHEFAKPSCGIRMCQEVMHISRLVMYLISETHQVSLFNTINRLI